MTKKGYKQTAEHRARLSAALKGRTFSPESRERQAAALRGRPLSGGWL